MGAEVKIENLTKRFGKATIWEDVSFTIPPGEISVLLGPSGTGKSVLLKHLVGLLRPSNGHVWIHGKDVCSVPESELYEIRKLFGVLFQDGALFGSQNIYDNIAFPLREHTKKSESEIKRIVLEKLDMVGLAGTEDKLPGEISGGMKKRAGLARALVLNPEILLFDEPDSGLDPVRVAYLDQLVVDINAQTGATCMIVTHNIGTARTIPDNIGLLYQKHLAMFGPRHQLLTSSEPVVRQFMNGRKQGPIGMSEEKDTGEQEKEKEEGGPDAELPPIEPQLLPTWPLIRRSMASPHGSHSFLKDPEKREQVKVNAKFGQDGLEPSEEPPAKPMSPDEFLEFLGMDPEKDKGSPHSEEDSAGEGSSGPQASSDDSEAPTKAQDGSDSSNDGSATRQFPVPAGDDQREAVGPRGDVAGAVTAATAAVGVHKGRSRDMDGPPDGETRPLPSGGRTRPTPDGRARPTPVPSRQPAGVTPRPAPQPEPVGATAPTAVYERPTGTEGAEAGNGVPEPNARREPAGSRRGMFASLLRRGDR